MSSIFSLLFCLSSGVVKKLQQETKKERKRNKIHCVELLVSKSVQDGIIDHNEFLAMTLTIKKMKVIKVN